MPFQLSLLGGEYDFNWVWTGNAVSYGNWYHSQPSRASDGDDCVFMSDMGQAASDIPSLLWFDQACTYTLCYVCQK